MCSIFQVFRKDKKQKSRKEEAGRKEKAKNKTMTSTTTEPGKSTDEERKTSKTDEPKRKASLESLTLPAKPSEPSPVLVKSSPKIELQEAKPKNSKLTAPKAQKKPNPPACDELDTLYEVSTSMSERIYDDEPHPASIKPEIRRLFAELKASQSASEKEGNGKKRTPGAL